MREIKFRARNADVPACWIYGYFVVENGGCYIINGINGEGKFKVRSGTEGQFTGLLDRNGKEIYEGDILKHVEWPRLSTVKFTRSAWRYHFSCSLMAPVLLPSYSKCFEVVGNIHENPELLEK